MNKLTAYQKEFFRECFFKNEAFNGWKNIATELLENGKCTVAGNKCIWTGGIGNFIKTSESKNAIDCLVYEFDLAYFISSEWYKDVRNQNIDILAEKKRRIEEEFFDIHELNEFAK